MMNWDRLRASVLQETDLCLSSSRDSSVEVKTFSTLATTSETNETCANSGHGTSVDLAHLRDSENYRDIRIASLEREVQDLRDALRAVTRQVDSQSLSYLSDKERCDGALQQTLDRVAFLDSRNVTFDAALKQIGREMSDSIGRLDSLSTAEEQRTLAEAQKRETACVIRRDHQKFIEELEYLRDRFSQLCTSSEAARLVEASMKKAELQMQGEMSSVHLECKSLASQWSAMSNRIATLEVGLQQQGVKVSSLFDLLEIVPEHNDREAPPADGTHKAAEPDVSSVLSFAKKGCVNRLEAKIEDLETEYRRELRRALDRVESQLDASSRQIQNLQKANGLHTDAIHEMQSRFEEGRDDRGKARVQAIEAEFVTLQTISNEALSRTQIFESDLSTQKENFERRLQQTESKLCDIADLESVQQAVFTTHRAALEQVADRKVADIVQTVESLQLLQRSHHDDSLRKQQEVDTIISDVNSRLSALDLFVKHARNDLDKASVDVEDAKAQIHVVASRSNQVTAAVAELRENVSLSAKAAKTQETFSAIGGQIAVVQNEVATFKRALEQLSESASDMSKTASFLNHRQESLGRDFDGIGIRTNDLSDALDLLAQRVDALRSTVLQHDTEIACNRLEAQSASNTSFLELQARHVAMLGQVTEKLGSMEGAKATSSVLAEAKHMDATGEPLAVLKPGLVKVEDLERPSLSEDKVSEENHERHMGKKEEDEQQRRIQVFLSKSGNQEMNYGVQRFADDKPSSARSGSSAVPEEAPSTLKISAPLPHGPEHTLESGSDVLWAEKVDRSVTAGVKYPASGLMNASKPGQESMSSASVLQSLDQVEYPIWEARGAKSPSPPAFSSGSDDDSSFRRWEQQIEEEAKRREALMSRELSGLVGSKEVTSGQEVTALKRTEEQRTPREHASRPLPTKESNKDEDDHDEDSHEGTVSLEGSQELGNGGDGLILIAHAEREGPMPDGQDAVISFIKEPG